MSNRLRTSGIGFSVYVEPETVEVELVPNYLTGLTLSNNAADPTNDIDIAVGWAADSGNAVMMQLGTALTKQLDAAWAAGTNQGMLDGGVVANDTYHIFLISDGPRSNIDILASLNPTSPTMPAGYIYKRRIGSIVRSGGAILGFVQDNDLFMLKSMVVDGGTVNPGVLAVTRTLTSLPNGIRVEALVMAGVVSTTNSAFGFYLSDLSQDDVAANYTAPNSIAVTGLAAGTAGVDANPARVMTNTLRQIRARLSISDANTTIYIHQKGWVDSRGK